MLFKEVKRRTSGISVLPFIYLLVLLLFYLAMNRMWEILNTFHLYYMKKFKIIIYKVGMLV